MQPIKNSSWTPLIYRRYGYKNEEKNRHEANVLKAHLGLVWVQYRHTHPLTGPITICYFGLLIFFRQCYAWIKKRPKVWLTTDHSSIRQVTFQTPRSARAFQNPKIIHWLSLCISLFFFYFWIFKDHLMQWLLFSTMDKYPRSMLLFATSTRYIFSAYILFSKTQLYLPIISYSHVNYNLPLTPPLSLSLWPPCFFVPSLQKACRNKSVSVAFNNGTTRRT